MAVDRCCGTWLDPGAREYELGVNNIESSIEISAHGHSKHFDDNLLRINMC